MTASALFCLASAAWALVGIYAWQAGLEGVAAGAAVASTLAWWAGVTEFYWRKCCA